MVVCVVDERQRTERKGRRKKIDDVFDFEPMKSERYKELHMSPVSPLIYRSDLCGNFSRSLLVTVRKSAVNTER